LNLLAQRQQGFGVERKSTLDGVSSTSQFAPSDSDSFTTIRHTAPQGETAGHHESPDQQPAEPRNPGPARARIEIKSFDLGLTPSEVVGTPDVLERFDDDGDGRIGLLDSNKAIQAREKVFTFAGLAAAPHSRPAPATPAPISVGGGAGAPKKLFVAPVE